MELLLIRHAAAVGNAERRFLGVTDAPLCPDGLAAARAAAALLPPVERVYLSPLLRCRQTAELLWPGAPACVVSDLRETDFGPFEGKRHEELRGDPLYEAWLCAPEAAVPGVEPPAEAGARAVRALESLLADAKQRGLGRIGVVSHGGTLMELLARFGRPARAYYGWSLPNCAGFAAAAEEPLALSILRPVGPWPV